MTSAFFSCAVLFLSAFNGVEKAMLLWRGLNSVEENSVTQTTRNLPAIYRRLVMSWIAIWSSKGGPILNLNFCSVKCELEGRAGLVTCPNCDCRFLQDDKWFCTQAHKGHVYEGCSWDLLRRKVQLGQGCCTILLCLSPCHQSELMSFVLRLKQHSELCFNSSIIIIIFLQALVTHVPDIIRTIISWTMDYLQEHVANWIREQGGWVRNYLLSWRALCHF